MELLNAQLIPIESIEPNEGQIEGLPRNPRFIRDDKFEALKRSILENPEMLGFRELLVYPFEGKYIAIGGNMRLAAMKDLGYREAPCKVLPKDLDANTLKAYTIKDNNGYGEWQWDMLLEDDWDLDELKDWGLDAEFLDNHDWENIPDITENQPDPKLEKDVKVSVVIPSEIKDMADEIKEKIKEVISEYDGVKMM